MSLVLLGLFVAVNVLLIRALLRWTARLWAAIPDAKDGDETVVEYLRDEVLKVLTSGLARRNRGNPIYGLVVAVGTLGGLLILDYHTIRAVWPWLLR